MKLRKRLCAAIATEKQRLAEERQAVEQALAARLGAMAMPSPDRSAQPAGALPASEGPAPAAKGRISAGCAELLLRAQLGDLTPAAREQLRLCR